MYGYCDFFFNSTGGLNSVLDRQALYHLSYVHSPFGFQFCFLVLELNSGPCAHYAGALPLEPDPQSVLV
jgi:hypothetical protein